MTRELNKRLVPNATRVVPHEGGSGTALMMDIMLKEAPTSSSTDAGEGDGIGGGDAGGAGNGGSRRDPGGNGGEVGGGLPLGVRPAKEQLRSCTVAVESKFEANQSMHPEISGMHDPSSMLASATKLASVESVQPSMGKTHS